MQITIGTDSRYIMFYLMNKHKKNIFAYETSEKDVSYMAIEALNNIFDIALSTNNLLEAISVCKDETMWLSVNSYPHERMIAMNDPQIVSLLRDYLLEAVTRSIHAIITQKALDLNSAYRYKLSFIFTIVGTVSFKISVK